MEQIRQKSDKKKLTKRQLEFLKIFKNKMCLVTQSCEASKLSRAMYYRWLEQPTFKDSIESEKLGMKDFGENALYNLIKSGNPAAIIFFNKCRNKDRGYVEKQEIEIAGNIPTLSKEECESEIKRLLKK